MLPLRGFLVVVLFMRAEISSSLYLCAIRYIKTERCITLGHNLPGWRWARIKQLALVGLSSSWHSEVCNALGDSFGVAHSKISDCGNPRTRGCQLCMISNIVPRISVVVSRLFVQIMFAYYVHSLHVAQNYNVGISLNLEKMSTVLEHDHFYSALLVSFDKFLKPRWGG